MEKSEENYSHVIIKEENLNETELDSAQPSLINFENDANIVFHSRQGICEQQEVEIPKIKTNHATIETLMILNSVDNNVNKDAHYDLTENNYEKESMDNSSDHSAKYIENNILKISQNAINSEEISEDDYRDTLIDIDTVSILFMIWGGSLTGFLKISVT